MKKLAKRLLAMTMSAVFLCPITAYAAPEDDARNLLSQVMEQQEALTDVNAFFDFDMELSGDVFDEADVDSLKMRLEMNMKASGLQDPSQMKYMMYMRATDAEGDEMTGSMYYVDGYMYNDMGGMKTRSSLPLGELPDPQSLGMTDADALASGLIRDVQMRPEEDNTVVSYTMDTGMLNNYITSVLESAGMGIIMQNSNFSIGSVKGEYVINPDGLCEKERLKMIMDMSSYGEDIRIVIDGDVGYADPGQPVEVPLPNPAEYVDAEYY